MMMHMYGRCACCAQEGALWRTPLPTGGQAILCDECGADHKVHATAHQLRTRRRVERLVIWAWLVLTLVYVASLAVSAAERLP